MSTRPSNPLPWLTLCVAAGLAMTPGEADAQIFTYTGAGIHAAWNPGKGRLGVGLRLNNMTAPNLSLPAWGFVGDATWFPGSYSRVSLSGRGGIMLDRMGPFTVTSAAVEAGAAWVHMAGRGNALQAQVGLAGELLPGPYFFLRGAIPILGEHTGSNIELGLGVGIPGAVGEVIEGRPLRSGEHGDRRVAWLSPTGERERSMPASVARLHPEARRALAASWHRAAQDEHASIPAFGALARDLAAAGAPPALVRAALAAARDEVHHTRACLGMNARYTGLPLAPHALAVPAGRQEQRSEALSRLAVESFEDGCLAEGIAAAAAAHAATAATDPKVRAIKARIAGDEARHAALGWEILAWAASAGGEPVRKAVRRAISRADATANTPAYGPAQRAFDTSAHGAALRRHGLLDAHAYQATRSQVVRGALRRASAVVS